jgi:hypothetical protein
MTTLDDNHTPTGGKGHGGHGHWMMVACCIPMLLIAIVLVATGIAGAGFIFAAVMCTATMWMMMRGMSGGSPGGK